MSSSIDTLERTLVIIILKSCDDLDIIFKPLNLNEGHHKKYYSSLSNELSESIISLLLESINLEDTKITSTYIKAIVGKPVCALLFKNCGSSGCANLKLINKKGL